MNTSIWIELEQHINLWLIYMHKTKIMIESRVADVDKFYAMNWKMLMEILWRQFFFEKPIEFYIKFSEKKYFIIDWNWKLL